MIALPFLILSKFVIVIPLQYLINFFTLGFIFLLNLTKFKIWSQYSVFLLTAFINKFIYFILKIVNLVKRQFILLSEIVNNIVWNFKFRFGDMQLLFKMTKIGKFSKCCIIISFSFMGIFIVLMTLQEREW